MHAAAVVVWAVPQPPKGDAESHSGYLAVLLGRYVEAILAVHPAFGDKLVLVLGFTAGVHT